MKGNLKMLPRLLKYMSTFLLVAPFMPVALAYNDGVDPDKLQLIPLRPGMEVTMEYNLGSRRGNGQSEQLFEVYWIRSEDISDGRGADRLWHRNEELDYKPFYESNTTNETMYLAIAYHSWSPTGHFWTNHGPIEKDLQRLRDGEWNLKIDYPEGRRTDPYIVIEMRRDLTQEL